MLMSSRWGLTSRLLIRSALADVMSLRDACRRWQTLVFSGSLHLQGDGAIASTAVLCSPCAQVNYVRHMYPCNPFEIAIPMAQNLVRPCKMHVGLRGESIQAYVVDLWVLHACTQAAPAIPMHRLVGPWLNMFLCA